MLGISKHFSGVRALHDVDLSLSAGEILAVIGENGAGKSTLMKILAGVEQPTAGSIRLDGREVEIDGAREAMDNGIALIHQELNLADNLDVGANIFLGREPQRFGWIDHAGIEARSRAVLELAGADFSPSAIVGDLSIGQQQIVEIAKALSLDARILIMDEPTSSLSQAETARLFRVVRELRGRGVSVIYISHRLGEVKELADPVVVLRDGENSGQLGPDEIDHAAMVRLMVGREVSDAAVARRPASGAPAIEVERLVVSSRPGAELSFAVNQGEMVGVAGLVGAGRTELLRALFGIDRVISGEVRLFGQPTTIDGAAAAISAGIALVPEDRKQQGLFVDMAVRENLSIVSLRGHGAAGWLDRDREEQLSAEMIAKLRIDTPSGDQPARFLSGGNQQKIVLAKWLAMRPRVLLLDEPTRGIDVGAREEIYQLMAELTDQGVAVLFVSSEMEEILKLADRVIVMHEGAVAGVLGRDDLSEESIMSLATGGEAAAPV